MRDLDIMKKAVTFGYKSNHISAKTQRIAIQLVLYDIQKFLRDVHKIEVRVWAEYYLTGINWNVQALKFNLSKEYQHLGFIENGTRIYGDNGEYDTYEQALEKGLELGLNLIK